MFEIAITNNKQQRMSHCLPSQIQRRSHSYSVKIRPSCPTKALSPLHFNSQATVPCHVDQVFMDPRSKELHSGDESLKVDAGEEHIRRSQSIRPR
jgi:hypothetical protein